MSRTYTCVLNGDEVVLRDHATAAAISMPQREFEGLMERRQRPKWSAATRIANGLYRQFNLADKLGDVGGDPADTPIVILNRHANWDYVAQTMCDDIRVSLDGVNNYVATAWFPASAQGYLTIEHGNRAEAITIATDDIDLQAATIDTLFQRDRSGERVGAVLVGTFEAIPSHIGGQAVAGTRGGAFGAFTVIASTDTDAEIRTALATHRELYSHVAA